MKKTLAVIAALTVVGGAASCYGAATLYVDSYTANFPIMFEGKTAVDGTYFQLRGGVPGGTLAAATEAKTGSTTSTFQLQYGDGNFDVGFLVIPGVADKGVAELQLYAWQGAATYEAATISGKSAVWQQTTGSWAPGQSPEATATGDAIKLPGSVVLQAVPEPSTIALGVLGAAALLIRRRK